MVQPDGPKWQYNTVHERCDLNAEQLSQKHTHINICQLFLFQSHNGYTNAPPCYFKHTRTASL